MLPLAPFSVVISLALSVAIVIVSANRWRGPQTWLEYNESCNLQYFREYLLVLVVFSVLFLPQCFCPHSLMNDHRRIWRWASASVRTSQHSLFLCAPSFYFRRLTWVIAEMEEHLRGLQGSGAAWLKEDLRELTGTRWWASWFMEQSVTSSKCLLECDSRLSLTYSPFFNGGLHFICWQQRYNCRKREFGWKHQNLCPFTCNQCVNSTIFWILVISFVSYASCVSRWSLRRPKTMQSKVGVRVLIDVGRCDDSTIEVMDGIRWPDIQEQSRSHCAKVWCYIDTRK